MVLALCVLHYVVLLKLNGEIIVSYLVTQFVVLLMAKCHSTLCVLYITSHELGDAVDVM